MAKLNSTARIPEEGVAGFNWAELEEPKKAIRRRSDAALKLESIPEAFAIDYPDAASSKAEGKAADMERCILYPGKFIYVHVDDVAAGGLKLSSEYIKEKIVNTDNLREYPGFKNYLIQNNNTVVGRVREIKKDSVCVDVLDAYYRLWVRDVTENYIKKETPIQIRDIELTRGGFIGKVSIWTLSELTGEDWINMCFVPGSQIVLNIEQDFEKWVGKDIMVLPQKFTSFNTVYSRGANCLVCSRKALLSYEGAKKLEDLYNRARLVESSGHVYESPVFPGTVTGVIKTSRKCGVFVELDDMYFTGLLPCDTYELAQYPVGAKVEVQIAAFEPTSQKVFNKNKNGNIRWPNMHVSFKIA